MGNILSKLFKKREKTSLSKTELETKSNYVVKRGTFLVSYNGKMYLKFDANDVDSNKSKHCLYCLLKTTEAPLPGTVMTIEISGGMIAYKVPNEAMIFFNAIYRKERPVKYSGNVRSEGRHFFRVDNEKLQNHPYYNNIKHIDKEFYNECKILE